MSIEESLDNNSENIEMATTEKLVEQIRAEYPNSPAFLQAAIEYGNKNNATDNIPSVATVLNRLGNLHRSAYGPDGDSAVVFAEHGTKNIPMNRVKEIYQMGLHLGSLATAIYHGEVELIDENGHVQKKFEKLI